ncbi:class I SAM-dependent methyltransferase [Pontivivens ytuae]|uniref:Class I SAM-dependent methyltransferase n=1 Tax=Pontivivens ytuae TaxID=2789856 RepID=A0A7S9LPV9_9RHOB|nr:class I SAM-dependent methyltransferase [Pontivivens ytuae]QPH52780.1 class I SAM-dependent methyltransferase [Pontivivens ytuae]
MSFSPDWLALREPADHAARSPALLGRLERWVGGRDLRIVDLGSGTGSSWRALAPRLGGHWTLTDLDPVLLERMPAGVERRQVDLSAELEDMVVRADIVTGSALIDLVSAEWLDRLVAALAPSTAVYFALSYDGREDWSPAPPFEAQALAAFRQHQEGDKGFGPALGPGATQHLGAALAARGWQVSVADSPWRLGSGQRALIEALADGARDAVAETGALIGTELEAWWQARRTAQRASVGHLDLLALPPS